MSKEYFDLIIFSPLDEEIESIFESFPHRERFTSHDVLKFTVDLGIGGLTGLVAQPPDWGNQEALRTAQHLLETYDTGLIVCIGIAGALASELRLGDVCYSGTIFDVNDRMKVKDLAGRKSKGITLQHNPKPFDTPRPITVALNHGRTDPELRAKFYRQWQNERRQYVEYQLAEGKLDAKHASLFSMPPSAINGALICGPVVASSNYKEILKSLDRKILAVETESGGVFQAAQDARVSALTIRGVSDPADARKSALEENTKGLVRQIASRNAVTYFRSQLNNPEFLHYLESERDRRTGKTPPVESLVQDPVDPILRALEQISADAGLKLKELCPLFPLTRKGYRLPSPRIKAMRLEDDPRSEEGSNFVDLAEAVGGADVTFVDIPRNYPDLALPWIWAETLTVEIVGDKQIVPVVIDANNLRPPSVIESAIPETILRAYRSEGAQLLFLIHNVDANSRSRTNHLAAEMKKYPNAKFVLITRGEGTLLLQRDMLRTINGRPYTLGDISFLAISEFIQVAFDFAASEAEVVAIKLKETFSKFKLSAHPSYFAGMPQPMVASLLQANRRAELIQIAVDGYLTLMAVQDEDKTNLNRSTRARYLARLAVGLEVEKRGYSQAELVGFTRAFAREYDFDDLDALPFISSFVEKGILQFIDDRVDFTLPFIRSYLLATALHDDEALAKRYFDFAADDFDFETFDLYSELGASEEIINAVEERLRRNVEALGVHEGEEFLLSDKLRPALLEKSDRLGEIRENVHRVIQRLQDKSDDGKGKQKLLDIADSTNAQVERKVGDIAPIQKQDGIVTPAELDNLLRDWRVANVLLGAAAQRLPGATKQRLAKLLVTGGAAIADKLTELYAKVDFKQVKENVLGSNEVDSFLSNYSKEMDKEQLRQLVGYMIDFVELYVLALPFRAVVSDLCDQSGDKVLSGSVDRAEAPEGLPNLLHATWLADLDSKKAMPKLRKQLAEMPFAPFLRITLVQHFLNRVYWRHSNPVHRDALLRAAQEVMRAFGSTLNKGKLERWIGKSDKSGAGVD